MSHYTTTHALRLLRFTHRPTKPPQWTPAPEPSHEFGLFNEAPERESEAAEAFCNSHPLGPPRLLSSSVVDGINTEGCKVWGLEQPESVRFAGRVDRIGSQVRVRTGSECGGVCLLGDLPLMAGLYDIQGMAGVYYEILIQQMDGIIAIGTSCRPYPAWRFPGWNRLSAGLHLDDFRKFFEDPCGGRDYTRLIDHISLGDTVGCGYQFSTASVFFTYNGQRLPAAFTGVYLPREAHDVYAAVGVEGSNEFHINFGTDLFRWEEANRQGWRVEGHVGRLRGDEPPPYT